ncbi:hypothetical protein [Clostridium sp. LP20]|uniref:hypothetical protein n=1 Tax=Clostridium sp. LP20 TaxID=3418665 RepID=UPI003EE7DD4F
MEKWKEEAGTLIERILDQKESKKNCEMELENDKAKLSAILEEHNLTEFACKEGRCNFVDSTRVGLIKEEVESTVTKVNNKEIDQIDIKDLQKDIYVHFLSVKENKEE